MIMKLGELEQGCVIKFSPEGLDWIIIGRERKAPKWLDWSGEWAVLESENGTRRALTRPRFSLEVILIVVGLQVEPTDTSGQWKVALADILQE